MDDDYEDRKDIAKKKFMGRHTMYPEHFLTNPDMRFSAVVACLHDNPSITHQHLMDTITHHVHGNGSRSMASWVHEAAVKRGMWDFKMMQHMEKSPTGAKWMNDMESGPHD